LHHSRPDIEAADPAASALRYRRFLAAFSRALLTMAALIDASLLLIALPDWQVYRLSGIGRALPVLPFAAGLLYVNRDDPALVVGARFGVGWAPNFGNRAAWLLVAGTVAAWAGLALLGAAAGM
jgi:uncharacterized membrane protein